MSNMLILKETMTNIAQAIRDKMYNNADDEKFYPREMPDLINNIYDWNVEFAYGIEERNEEHQFWCGKYVTSMKQAFKSQIYRDSPVVCGNNVTDMSYAYYGCTNLSNAFYVGPNVENLAHTFELCTNIINIPVTSNTVNDMSYSYANCFSKGFDYGLWLADIPEMPCCNPVEANFVCGDNTTLMDHTYYNCYILQGHPSCGNNVKNMTHAYDNCFCLIGNPAIGNNVADASYAYYQCTNLYGQPICPENVTNMQGLYFNCHRMFGHPVVGENVKDMAYAYQDCWNLTGQGISGDKVTNMYRAYYNCSKIEYADCESKVENMDEAFYNCVNLTGSAIIGQSVSSAYLTYGHCNGISRAIIHSQKLNRSINAFHECMGLHTIDINQNIVPDYDEQYHEYKNFPAIQFVNCIGIHKAVPFKPGYFSKDMYKGCHALEGNLFQARMQDKYLYQGWHETFMERYNVQSDTFKNLVEEWKTNKNIDIQPYNLLNFYTNIPELIQIVIRYYDSIENGQSNTLKIGPPGCISEGPAEDVIVELRPYARDHANTEKGFTDGIIFYPNHNLRLYFSENYRYEQFY